MCEIHDRRDRSFRVWSPKRRLDRTSTGGTQKIYGVREVGDAVYNCIRITWYSYWYAWSSQTVMLEPSIRKHQSVFLSSKE